LEQAPSCARDSSRVRAVSRYQDEEVVMRMEVAPRPLAVGDEAPDFTLRHTFEHDVTLSEWTASGPVILAFYVFDFGSV
jgi:hypothetical protein